MVKSPLARTGLATLLTLTSIGTLAPSAHAAPSDAGQQVVCDDIGLVQVQRSASSWRILDEAPLSVAATGLPCRAATTDADGHLKVTGEPLLHVQADTGAVIAAADRAVAQRQATNGARIQAAASSDPAGYGAVVAFPYAKELANYAATRSGNIGVAWRKAGTSTVYSYYKGSKSNVTASIVKVQIMATVMYQAQQQGRGLTSWEKSQLVPMIRVSDNTAATNLYQHVGGRTAVQSVINRMGLRETTLGPGGYWGLTVTTAPDQVVLVDHFSRKNPVLNDSMRSYGLSLMRGASSWGVNQGPGTDIAVKNGWLPRTDGWHVNSVGYNHHTPAYTAAVLTHSASGSLETQKATIAGISRILWNKRSTTTGPVTPAAPRRGDFTGDGRADLWGVKGDQLFLFTGKGRGQLSAPVAKGSGWRTTTWIGSAGDVTRDGRADLLARRSDGTLHLYRGNGNGTVTYSRQVGRGWDGITALAAVGDFDGNRTPDLLGRAKDGRLIRYALPSTGGASNAGTVGTSWNGMSAILGVLGVNNDALGDVIAMRRDGLMFAYTSTGSKLKGGTTPVGQGWHPTLVTSPGDLTGDGIDDISYQTSTGLKTYATARGGKLQPGQASGTSAAGFTVIG